jgi:hypothetical protein
MGFEAAREYLFRTVSQTMIHYRDGPLSEGIAGHVHGGDRLPWAPSARGDNFAPLREPVWQVHVYGNVGTDLDTWCKQHNLPLHRFDWSFEHETAGLARGAAYLIRPDTYVALADTAAEASTLERYFRQHQIKV